jgi:uncharacterized membrane protein
MRTNEPINLAFALLLTALSVQACGDSTDAPANPSSAGRAADEAVSRADAAVCAVSAPTSCPTPKPRYADVAPIFKQRCVVCHNGAAPDSPWPLTSYEHIADWYDSIRSELSSCAMPPPASGLTMTDDERVAILSWIRCGFPK